MIVKYSLIFLIFFSWFTLSSNATPCALTLTDLPETTAPLIRKYTKVLLDTEQEVSLIPPSQQPLFLAQQTAKKVWPDNSFEEVFTHSSTVLTSKVQPPLMTDLEFYTSLIEKRVPQEIIETLELVRVQYRGFDGEGYEGQIVIHKEAAESIKRIFKKILKTRFYFTSILPISHFGWSDSLSVGLNNSSGFNWRLVDGSLEISDHAFGAAFGINPLLNPWVRAGVIDGRYDPTQMGTLTRLSEVVQIFLDEGWEWGG